MLRKSLTSILLGVLLGVAVTFGSSVDAKKCGGLCEDSIYDAELDVTFYFEGCVIYQQGFGKDNVQPAVEIAVCTYM